MEGALIGAPGRGEAEAGEELCEDVHLENKVHIKVTKLAPMHIVDWGEAQEADAVLAAYHQWLKTCKDTPLPKKRCTTEAVLGLSHGNGRRACPLPHVEQPGSE